jgi:hypothetical protein
MYCIGSYREEDALEHGAPSMEMVENSSTTRRDGSHTMSMITYIPIDVGEWAKTIRMPNPIAMAVLQ